ncbi:DUF4328 domain-containing protein [Gordonia sp. LSe1-13]|uniref:DUF4328 domain-containing protein n=1 Tax=Gordonia sesuvii TaxID=3116777 RepID=A0ABU7MGQ2_9ACTN|nr:DUF4328 domain-containing protein [Gordonia sp. LSe1-13]
MVDSDLLGAPTTPRDVADVPRPAPTPRPAAPVPGPRPSPVSGPRSGRLYRSRHVRWVARRPPEAIPARRRSDLALRPRYIPRYLYIPQWGLRDAPVVTEAALSRRDTLTAALSRALHVLAAALGLAAVAHLGRYILLVVNRSTPVPAWTDLITSALVLFGGLLSVGCFVYATVVFARWVVALRADAYRRDERRDPRRRWQILLMAGVPLLNVWGAAVLLHEAANMRTDLDRDRTRRRLSRIWVGWVLVNVVAVAAVVTRLVAMSSGSIQTGADALLAVVVSAACSGVFAWWLPDRLDATFGERREDPVPSRRWVAVG